jgi:hypothetical protein
MLGRTENKNSLVIRETATGRELLRLLTGYVVTLAFSPDGKSLAASRRKPVLRKGGASKPTSDKIEVPEICIWEVATGKERLCFETKGVYGFYWSPDGRLLATNNWSKDLYVWDATTGQQIQRIRGRWSAAPVAFSPDRKTLVTGMDDSTIMAWDLPESGKPGSRSQELGAKELERLWDDLVGADAAKAHQAIWTLVAAPEKAVPFLKGRAHPVLEKDLAAIRQLIVDLDSGSFTVRETAAKNLVRVRFDAEPLLRQALQNKPSLEVRRRLEALLAGPMPNEPCESLARLRALEALEYIGDKQAYQVVEELTKGAPEARLTQEAKASLERLNRRRDLE